MKTFNRKVTARIFYTVAALDIVWLVLSHSFPGTWAIVPWWIINAPGFVLAIIFGSLLPPSVFAMTCMMIVAGLFSALVWSAVFGYVFRLKPVA